MGPADAEPISSGPAQREAHDEFASTGGTVRGDGTINAVIINGGGTVAPGTGFSPGTLDIVGDAFFFNGGVLEIEVSGLNSFDVLTVLGTARFFAGTSVRFSFENCFAPKAGDSFEFLNAGLLELPVDPADLEFAFDGLQEGFEFDVSFDEFGIEFEATVNSNTSCEF